ncbi:hypothetical protein EI171_08395 [Bradyrhizobium sp. LCT2]|uniref:hypothetical protein n=1 Tax=Bradyrhizobium sp. LCT2 TaxID=2493093 RepID=UPI001373EE23|nr:hypothetical protein [Bradyrhizobium sp. LCT2]QHP67446.1 hypothetical protein EI171_08395 [Bradyrhizobium sp. LCT2]
MTFEFDPVKSFDENVAAFKAHVEQLDPECAAIFFSTLETLTGDGNPDRARARRTSFNTAVAAALDALPDEDAGIS